MREAFSPNKTISAAKFGIKAHLGPNAFDEGAFSQRDGQAAIGAVVCRFDDVLVDECKHAFLQCGFLLQVQGGRQSPNAAENFLRVL